MAVVPFTLPATVGGGTGGTTFPFTFPGTFGEETPPPPLPAVIPEPRAFLEIEQLLGDRRQAYLSRKVPQPLIRLWDKEMQLIARVMIPESWDCEEIAYDNGTAHIEIVGKDNDWLREIVCFKTRPAEDLHITIDPDPDKPHDWKNRWGGKVDTIEDEETKGQPTKTVLNCISNRIHLQHIMIAAMPLLPHAVQIPKMFLWGGPCVTTCATAVMINLFRIYTLNGWWPLPRKIFAPETWLENLSSLNWPVQVMPVNVLLDQSRWCTIGARWKDAQTVLTPVMKDCGVICHAYTWIPGDPAPYTQVYGKAWGEILKPTRACVILSFEDQSGVGGPTGTAVDGALNLFAATFDDLITETLFAVDGDGDGETDPWLRKILGVAPKRPPFVYRDTGYGGVNSRKMVIHKAKSVSFVVGGKSPGWVNMAITFAIRYGLAQLEQVINYGLGAYQQYGTSGLDNLYQGQLDDCVSRDTKIQGPDGEWRIDKLAEYGGPFRVWSITPEGKRVSATAVMAFKKGTAELFEYTLADGRSIKATGDHRFLTDNGYVRAHTIEIGSRIATTDGQHLPVVDIQFIGVDDYYDMHVPGWENYAANGIWNHNTLLAFMPFVDPQRSGAVGSYARNESFGQGSGSAFTINSVMDMRKIWYETRPYTSFKFDVGDGAPFVIGEDIRLGSRVNAERRGVLYTDQIMAIKRSGDRNSSGRPVISFGDDSREEDPFAQGMASLANVANFAALLAGSGDLF